MNKWYVCADINRPAGDQEEREIGMRNALVYCGRVKTIVTGAETPKEAIEAGREKIESSLSAGYRAINLGCMRISDVKAMGDDEVYNAMRTV